MEDTGQQTEVGPVAAQTTATLSTVHSKITALLSVDERPPEETSYVSLIKFYFFRVIPTSLVVSVPTAIFVYCLSLLPWMVGDYLDPETGYVRRLPNTAVAMTMVSVAFVAFGPVYITYYTCLIVQDVKQVLCNKPYMCFVTLHSVAWPALFIPLAFSGFFVWYYYLDFVYFGVTFLPISFWVSYEFLYKQVNDPAMLASDSVAKRKRLWFATVYALVELAVILSALSYTFMIFPYVVQFDDTMKIVWRLLVHPIWFELTMVMPQRLLVYHMPLADPWLKILPLYHSLFHVCMFGRMLLLSVQDPVASVYLNFISNAEEIVMRLTVLDRDRWVMAQYAKIVQRLYRSGDSGDDLAKGQQTVASKERREADMQLLACIINTETLFEMVGIWITPPLMICFAPFGSLWSFNASPTTYGGPQYVSGGSSSVDYSGNDASGNMSNAPSILVSSVVQLLLEIVTDVLCTVYESRIHRLPLISQWKLAVTRRMLCFFVYGLITMAVLGTIYVSLNLPRALYCTDQYHCRV